MKKNLGKFGLQHRRQQQFKMTRYSNDPRQITAKFSSSCSKCKTKIKKGATIYYWPSSREVFCTCCGDAPYRQFLSSAADDDVCNGIGNPYAW